MTTEASQYQMEVVPKCAASDLDIPPFLRRQKASEDHMQNEKDSAGYPVKPAAEIPSPQGELATESDAGKDQPTVQEIIDTIQKLKMKSDKIMDDARQECAEINEHVRLLKKQASKMVNGL